jgi:hypothetical protein
MRSASQRSELIIRQRPRSPSRIVRVARKPRAASRAARTPPSAGQATLSLIQESRSSSQPNFASWGSGAKAPARPNALDVVSASRRNRRAAAATAPKVWTVPLPYTSTRRSQLGWTPARMRAPTS